MNDADETWCGNGMTTGSRISNKRSERPSGWMFLLKIGDTQRNTVQRAKVIGLLRPVDFVSLRSRRARRAGALKLDLLACRTGIRVIELPVQLKYNSHRDSGRESVRGRVRRGRETNLEGFNSRSTSANDTFATPQFRDTGEVCSRCM